LDLILPRLTEQMLDFIRLYGILVRTGAFCLKQVIQVWKSML